MPWLFFIILMICNQHQTYQVQLNKCGIRCVEKSAMFIHRRNVNKQFCAMIPELSWRQIIARIFLFKSSLSLNWFTVISYLESLVDGSWDLIRPSPSNWLALEVDNMLSVARRTATHKHGRISAKAIVNDLNLLTWTVFSIIISLLVLDSTHGLISWQIDAALSEHSL